MGILTKLLFLAAAILGLAASWVRVEARVGKPKKRTLPSDPWYPLGIVICFVAVVGLLLAVALQNVLHSRAMLVQFLLPGLAILVFTAAAALVGVVIRRGAR